MIVNAIEVCIVNQPRNHIEVCCRCMKKYVLDTLLITSNKTLKEEKMEIIVFFHKPVLMIHSL